jgi:hypothetical protein
VTMAMRRSKTMLLVADKGARMVRESAKPLGQPIVTFIGGDTDLLCGRCQAVLVQGAAAEAPLGDALLRCPSCEALNDPLPAQLRRDV